MNILADFSKQVMTGSSRETLEALAEDLAVAIKSHLGKEHPHRRDGREAEWSLIISLEKPTAIPLADAACIELRLHSRDIVSRQEER